MLLFSNAHKKGIVSCPVSPSGGLRLPSRTMNSSGKISPSPTSNLHTASGPSTPQPENNALANHNRRAVEGVRREFRNEKACLADCASHQQLVRDNAKPKAPINRKSCAPVAGRTDGL